MWWRVVRARRGAATRRDEALGSLGANRAATRRTEAAVSELSGPTRSRRGQMPRLRQEECDFLSILRPHDGAAEVPEPDARRVPLLSGGLVRQQGTVGDLDTEPGRAIEAPVRR